MLRPDSIDIFNFLLPRVSLGRERICTLLVEPVPTACPTLSGTKYSPRSDFVARVTLRVATDVSDIDADHSRARIEGQNSAMAGSSELLTANSPYNCLRIVPTMPRE